MPPSPELVNPASVGFAAPPDPGQAGTLDDLVERLRLLKVWAGDPSYERITHRINSAWSAAGRPEGDLAGKTTVVDCFRPGRRRLNTDLVVAVVQALHPEAGYVAQWSQVLRVIGGEVKPASQVRVQSTLPQDLAIFTGRTRELDRLRHVRQESEAVVISAIEGMAGVGKTQLAIHAAHELMRQQAFDRVLFVNLRGFHPDQAQPPADPAAVLDGFLRLLGVPGQQIPHDLPARAAAYRDRLAGTHTLVVLDNAADTEQVRPLLPTTPGCLALITSRRSLADLVPAIHLSVDVFSADEAVSFLTCALPGIPVGSDPHAAARIAGRCGHLPLALGLIAGHIRSTPGWTLTEHADRLDERHHHRRLESGVELALNLSYQHLPTGQQRLLRLAALHPGQDIDAYAAAALTGTEQPAAQHHLVGLCRDHLLQQANPGRYTLHDLVRGYATSRAGDEDSPPARRAALTRLFDYYLATTATAMDMAYPHERHRRPTVQPAGTPAPILADQKPADRWLDTELPNLLAIAQHTAEHGWPEHNWQLSAVFDRHLRTRGRYRDTETLHHHSLDLARRLGNQPAEVNALNGLGYVHRRQGHHEQSVDHHERALQIAQTISDHTGQVEALNGLGHVQWMLGGYEQAGDHHGRALQIAQEIGDRVGELNALNGLGDVQWTLGRFEQADDHHGRALRIAQEVGDRVGERVALVCLASVQMRLGRREHAGSYLEGALQIARETGDRVGERHALHGLGDIHRVQGDFEQATSYYERALQIAHDTGDRSGELNGLNGLGHVKWMQGRYEQAGEHFRRALHIAHDIGGRVFEVTALHGLARVHRMLGYDSEAADCYRQVFDLATELGSGNWQFEAMQGLGRLYHATGHPGQALTHQERALQHANDIAQPTDQARAHDGLAYAHHALNHHDLARQHWQHALDILTNLGVEHTEDVETSVPNIRAQLTSLGQQPPNA